MSNKNNNVLVKDIRQAITTYLETEGLSPTDEMRQKIGKTLGIQGDEVEKNLLFLQTKDKLAQKTVGGKQVWFVTKPKKEKGIIPKIYKEYSRKIVFTVPCLGTYPIQAVYWLDEKEKRKFMMKMGWDGKSMLQVHEQRRCDGKYYIWSDWIRALLRDGMYIVEGKTKSLAQNHLKPSDAEIHTNGMGEVQTHVSIRGGTQGGISKYEAIMPNAYAVIKLSYPSNLITEAELDTVLSEQGRSKGFGGNHSRGYGKFEIQ
jgi:hypothetical protein